MKAVKRVLVVDPDTGERAIRHEFDMTQPWDDATVAAFKERLSRKTPEARLQQARGLLAEIVDTPEHDAAIEVLDRGQALDPSHPEADSAWTEFCALYEHAKRRIVARKAKATARAAAKAKAQKEAKKLGPRNRKIVIEAKKLLANDTEKHELAGILARRVWPKPRPHKLSSRQIRAILKKAEGC